MKASRFKISGRIVNRKLNRHTIKVLEPTRKLTLEEADKRVRELLKKIN